MADPVPSPAPQAAPPPAEAAPAPVQSQSAQQVFDSATKLLSEGKAQDAADHYRAILGQNVTSSDLEANFGRALVETGKVGEGIQHLMNAIALERSATTFRESLGFAQSRVESGLGNAMSHPVEWGNRIGSWLRPAEALSCASLCLLVLLVCKVLKIVIKRSQAIAIAFLAFLFVVAGGLAVYGRSVAVVLTATELRTAPLASSEVLQPLPAGTRLRIMRTSGEFAEVERTGSFRGWTNAANLARSPY